MSSSDGASSARCAARYTAAIARIVLGIGDGSDDTEGNTFVQAAHPITLQIDSDVLIPGGAQFAHEPLADLSLECARQFVAADLETRQCRRPSIRDAKIVMSHAAHAKAHGANRGLGTLDDAQLLGRHF